MAANVESMFYVRETPWHGLGTKVQEAPTSKDALILAGLDWHTGNVKDKMEEAKNTLFLADRYMEELGKEFENLRKITLSDKKVMDYIEILLPIEDGATPQ